MSTTTTTTTATVVGADRNPDWVLRRVTLLTGHVDAGSAYVDVGYPRGQSTCTRRVWVQTGGPGRYAGKQRRVVQTTDPDKPGEVWAAPHEGHYHPVVALYLDRAGHAEMWALGRYARPVDFVKAELTGVSDQLGEYERDRFAARLDTSRRLARRAWDDFERHVTAMAQIIADTGRDPLVVREFWVPERGARVYLSADVAVYLTEAWRRVDSAAQAG